MSRTDRTRHGNRRGLLAQSSLLAVTPLALAGPGGAEPGRGPGRAPPRRRDDLRRRLPGAVDRQARSAVRPVRSCSGDSSRVALRGAAPQRAEMQESRSRRRVLLQRSRPCPIRPGTGTPTCCQPGPGVGFATGNISGPSGPGRPVNRPGGCSRKQGWRAVTRHPFRAAWRTPGPIAASPGSGARPAWPARSLPSSSIPWSSTRYGMSAPPTRFPLAQ